MTKRELDIADFIAKFADAIDGMDETALSPMTPLSEFEEWDSLAYLVTMVMTETEYGVEISGNELDQCETVQEIADLVAMKQAE